MQKIKYSRFDQVLMFATALHDGQVRKETNIPYVTHPVAVAEILARHDFAPHVVYAGLLHDVIEDTSASKQLVVAKFGSDVAELVVAVTETKKDAQGRRIPWELRKVRQIEHYRETSLEVAQLKAADVLHNLTTITADVQAVGDKLWERFNAGRDKQLWYYHTLTEILAAKLSPHKLSAELLAIINLVLTVCTVGCADLQAPDVAVREQAQRQEAELASGQ